MSAAFGALGVVADVQALERRNAKERAVKRETRCAVYIATSVDGWIAKADGDIGWLQRPEYAGCEVAGVRYEDFIATVDVLVMGRRTFEKVLSFSDWPYGVLSVVVLSTHVLEIPQRLEGKVRWMGGDPKQVLVGLAAEGKKRVYVDGGATLQGFLREGLIDEIIVTYIPILLGDGIPLFGVLGQEIPLRFVSVAASACGFVQVRYEVPVSLDGVR